jgi:prepilin-type N-terminal cleavage/methylation domain-containing protein
MTRQKGFTLIEMVLVIVLVAICGWVAVDMFIGQNRIYKVQTAELNVTSDARGALDDVDNHVRAANRVLDDYTTYSSGPTELVLQIISVDASNEIIPATFDNVVFYLDGTNFFREVFPNALSSRAAGTKKLASNVNSLLFTYNDISFPLVTAVTTDMTIQEDAGIQTRSITISSKSTLRNY